MISQLLNIVFARKKKNRKDRDDSDNERVSRSSSLKRVKKATDEQQANALSQPEIVASAPTMTASTQPKENEVVPEPETQKVLNGTLPHNTEKGMDVEAAPAGALDDSDKQREAGEIMDVPTAQVDNSKKEEGLISEKRDDHKESCKDRHRKERSVSKDSSRSRSRDRKKRSRKESGKKSSRKDSKKHKKSKSSRKHRDDTSSSNSDDDR